MYYSNYLVCTTYQLARINHISTLNMSCRIALVEHYGLTYQHTDELLYVLADELPSEYFRSVGIFEEDYTKDELITVDYLIR